MEIARNAIKPTTKDLKSCFEIENTFYTKKIIINRGSNRIPFSFVKKAREDTINARTM